VHDSLKGVIRRKGEVKQDGMGKDFGKKVISAGFYTQFDVWLHREPQNQLYLEAKEPAFLSLLSAGH
jgi:hypothetical protein